MKSYIATEKGFFVVVVHFSRLHVYVPVNKLQCASCNRMKPLLTVCYKPAIFGKMCIAQGHNPAQEQTSPF